MSKGGKHEMRLKMQDAGAAGETLLGFVGYRNEFGFQQTLGNIKAFKVT